MKSEQKLRTPKEVAKWLDVSVDWVHNHATLAETRRFLGLGVRLARDGASGVSLQERFASRRFSR